MCAFRFGLTEESLPPLYLFAVSGLGSTRCFDLQRVELGLGTVAIYIFAVDFPRT